MKTLEDLEASTALTLTCTQVAGILNADAQTIHLQAVTKPEMLGFPVIVDGTRVRIPRIPFIKFMRGELCQQVTQSTKSTNG